MKYILLVGAAALAVAGIASDAWIAGLPTNGVATASVSDGAYVLQFAGSEASCTVRRTLETQVGDSTLVIGDGCSDALAGAARWRDNADGSVSFLSPNGRTVLEFAQSDGAAYETFRAGAPLATLVSLD